MFGFLYGQTEYNILSNAMHLEDYIAYAKKTGLGFLTLTDSNLYAYYKFANMCKKENIKPIIGLEVEIETSNLTTYTVLLYAKNDKGLQNLLYISSMIKTDNSIDKEKLIKERQKGIAVVFAGSQSKTMLNYVYESETNAISELKRLTDTYESFYLGYATQNQNLLEYNDKLFSYANHLGIKSLPIHRTLYLEKNDYRVYECLRLIDGSDVKVSDFEDYSFPLNLENEFKLRKDLFNNLDEFISEIKIIDVVKKASLPKYPLTNGSSAEEFLRNLCGKGLKRRLIGKNANVNTYESRLDYELKVIHKMGYDDYFLIVWDFIRYAKQNEIFVGPGRGSAAGSLVAYCLGITDVDPISFDLLFERFLNPERISMPDIDTDFPDNKRDMVIEYVKNLYGANHVCNISAYGTFLVKSSIRDLARVLKIESSRVDEVVKKATEIESYEELIKIFADNKDINELLTMAKKLENLPRHISTHAAGIILSDENLFDMIPIQTGIGNMYQSQLEASDLEKMGLLKMDFLGIRNLTIVADCIDEISGMTQKLMREIPLDDKKTYQVLQRGDTLGIFQLESGGITRVLKKLVPTEFEDIIAVLALYRPGPMENIDEYIARHHGKKYEYLHPNLEPILKRTYGIIVYQEQIMKIGQLFAGYSLAEADLLRRAVSKKDEGTLLKERDNFVKRSITQGYSEKIASDIYDYIVKFANYGFNRSHSVAYAFLSYQMAYLKANYFQIFMAHILNNSIGSVKALTANVAYAKARGVVTIKPNINISSYRFVSTKKGLYMPLQSIFGLGEIVAHEIVKERENGLFKTFDDFKERCPFVNARVLESLIFSGCFDDFGKTKYSLINKTEANTSLFDKHFKDLIEINKEYDFNYLAEKEMKYLGMNFEYSLFKDVDTLYKKYRANSIAKAKINVYGNFIVRLSNIKTLKTKNNELMIKGVCFDESTSAQFVMFPNSFEKFKDILNDSDLFVVEAKLDEGYGKSGNQLIIDKISPAK